MRFVVVSLCTLLLAGCGSTASVDSPEDAAFFLISHGKANGVMSVLGGGVSYCKVTQYNVGGSDYLVDVQYDGNKCEVQGTAGAKQN